MKSPFWLPSLSKQSPFPSLFLIIENLSKQGLSWQTVAQQKQVGNGFDEYKIVSYKSIVKKLIINQFCYG